MRIVFVHGIAQEGRDPHELRLEWLSALMRGWSDGGLSPPPFEAAMPFFGVELNAWASRGRDAGTRSGTEVGSAAFQLRMLTEIAGVRGVDLELEAGDSGASRGLNDWEVVRAAARSLEVRMPLLGDIGLRFVQQVDAYLNTPGAKQAIDALVRETLKPGPTVVVAHSLGTIVAYSILRGEIDLHVPLLVTLGSPLGMRTVRD